MSVKIFKTSIIIGAMLVFAACGSENAADKVSSAEPTTAIVQIDTKEGDKKTGEEGKKETGDQKEESTAAGADKEEQPDVKGIGDKPADSGESDNAAAPTAEAAEGGTDDNKTADTPADDEDREETGSAAATGSISADDAYLELAGTSLTTGDDFKPYINSVGDPRTEEGQACLEGGYDTNYYYGDDLAVYTYARDGKQVIYDIYIASSSYSTPKGIKPGVSSKDDVRAAYGEPDRSMPASDIYNIPGGSKVLTVSYSGDSVESVDISEQV